MLVLRDLTGGAQSPTIRAMHQEPWEPLDGPYSSERKPDSQASDADPSTDPTVDLPSNSPGDSLIGGEVARFPLPLLNWQVVDPIMEIDGEATLIEETEIEDAHRESVSIAPPALPQRVATSGDLRAAIRDQLDDVVVGEMPFRRAVVMPGESATYEVTVANQGRWGALFEVGVEGWIDEAWLPDLPVRVQLEPGMRQTITLTIQPPRHHDALAGEHALAVVVRAGRYPGRITRLAATLTVERFAALKVGTPQPREVEVSWFVPSATTRLPITNQSNYPATIHLQGVDRGRQCDFTFYVDGDADSANLDDGVMGTARIALQPGQSVSVPVEIRTRQRPFFGIVPRVTSFRLVARVDTEPPLRRAGDGQLAVAALIGPWHMAIAAVLGVVALFGTGLAGLALLVALRSSPANNPAPQVVATAAPVAPVTFVIQMDQPMPTRVPDGALIVAANGVADQNRAQENGNTTIAPPSVPIVRADQVTAPGEPTPVGQQPLRPLVVTTPNAQQVAGQSAAPQSAAPQAGVQLAPAPANNANMTYGQMFKDVGMQFDLDWRLLAAQAYLESGFDSLALSGQGDMGLMQIRPGTWNEWAPTVEASDPFDSYSNVLVGAAYLNHLRAELSERGFSQQEWMLVAYNWGPDKVFTHLEAGGTWESLDPARRQYADDILRIAASIPPS